MKRFVFNIDSAEAEWIFSPIRSKYDYIILLMKVVKLMLINCPPAEDKVVGQIVLKSAKMSRLIFSIKDKIFSVVFPFFVNYVDGVYVFYSNNYLNLDHKATSSVLELIRDENIFSHNDVLFFSDPIDVASKSDSDIWNLVRDLMLVEDGYLRYDHDPDNVNGHIHPLNHIDVFYSTPSTFKIGLKSRVPTELFENVVDLLTDCYYLEAPK